MSFFTLLEATGAALAESIQHELDGIGLKDSRIRAQVDYAVDPKTLTLSITLPDYYKYIESGRRPRATKVPIAVLLKWLKRKNIQARTKGMKLNQLAFAIQGTIFRRGIEPRPFLDRAKKRTPALGAFGESLTLEMGQLVDKSIAKHFK